MQNRHAPQDTAIPVHGDIIGNGDFQYRINSHWGKLDAETTPVENCHDFAIDSQGRIIMVTDHPVNNFIVYDKQGNLLDAWGTEYPGAHAIEVVNENGEDFIYVVDCGWVINRHWDGKSTDAWDSPFNKVVPQAGFVAKLTIDGRLIFTIGHPQTVAAYRPDMPFRPTDITIAANGDIYITDGYGSDFVLQYDSQGRFIRCWGGHNNTDSRYNLNNTHGIAIDNRQVDNPILVVSSRADQCLKQFSLRGEYLGCIDTPGAWIHGPVFYGNHFYAAVCWSDIKGKNVDDSGFISIFDSANKVVSNLGAHPAEYIHEKLQPMCSNWQVFKHVHGLCIDDKGNIYVGQWRANQSYPIKLEKINS
ncbi:6-bladed beta-propeller [Paraglaciecola arctica]|uniref:6-bladed beta-propeller n=1 Tax=Paraglaciecola arctica TaxID=1128911 RepID=UPI001C06989C|nr:6-bladed beta-propeller [Paraglaciecola arctica]MBU3005408.1 6-bladed beta-propeller [Paraglaciecola arctica]